jgi:PKD repeat protein
MTLVELMVAISILAIVMTGLALSIGVDYKAVALARARQVAESVANQRLEDLRDVDYDNMALSSQPTHSTDSTNPDYYVSTNGVNYDVTGAGQNEALIVDDPNGPVDHLDTAQSVGTTEVDVYEYVTWVDDPGIAGTQNLKRLTVVVQYHTVPTIGQAKMLRESVVLTPGNVSLGASAASSIPASFSYAAASSPAYAINFTDTSTGSPTGWQWDFNGDGTTDSTVQNPSYTFSGAGSYPVTLTVTKGLGTGSITNTVTVSAGTPTTTTASTCGSFSIAGSSGASGGYTASTTVTITMSLSGCGGNLYTNFSNDGGSTWGADFAYSSSATTLAWTVTSANGSKTISGQARSTFGGTPWSLSPQSIILDTTPPTIPSTLSRTLSCSGSTRTVVLSWTAATDNYLVGYHVYASSDGSTYSLLASTAVTTKTTTNQWNTVVYYKVKAYDAAGNESSATSVIQLAKQQCS